MSAPLITFIVSSSALALVTLLFSLETRRGVRYLSTLRSRLDFYLLKMRHSWNISIRTWGRYFFRQIFHYFFHTLLIGMISSLAGLEERLRSIARINRVLAKKSERERTARNTLDEIALHKLEMKLTAEEQKIRKRKSLEGMGE